MVDRLLAIVAPHSCCGCGNPGSLLCETCKNDIIFEPFSVCFGCLRPVGASAVCPACQGDLGVSDGWSVGVREGVLKELLDRYKFDAVREAGPACGSLLDAVVPPLPPDVVVVPAPTSPAHRRVRGFDHMYDVTRSFARRRSLKSRRLFVRKSSDTQHFKNKAERLAYTGQDLKLIGGVPSTVLLVDDIYTTGATLGACVRILREAGANQVFVAIIARQTLDDMSDL